MTKITYLLPVLLLSTLAFTAPVAAQNVPPISQPVAPTPIATQPAAAPTVVYVPAPPAPPRPQIFTDDSTRSWLNDGDLSYGDNCNYQDIQIIEEFTANQAKSKCYEAGRTYCDVVSVNIIKDGQLSCDTDLQCDWPLRGIPYGCVAHAIVRGF